MRGLEYLDDEYEDDLKKVEKIPHKPKQFDNKPPIKKEHPKNPDKV